MARRLTKGGINALCSTETGKTLMHSRKKVQRRPTRSRNSLKSSAHRAPSGSCSHPVRLLKKPSRHFPNHWNREERRRVRAYYLPHPIADRRCVVRALTPSPSLLRGTRRRNVRLAEIGKIRAHQPHIGRHPIAEGRVRGQRENHVHHVVAEAAAVEGGKAE